MNPFSLHLPSRVLFGPASAGGLPAAIADRGRRALVVTGSSPQRIADLLASVGPHEVVAISGEPSLDDARAAAATGRRHRCDVVVAIGGGSVIDLAKAAAMLLGNGGDPLDYLEVIGAGRAITSPSLPLIALPTTAGTGSEVTANAVLASREHGVKASLRSPTMVPDLAIVDPVLTLTCSPAVTAAAGVDALTQCLEPYLSNSANPVTDAFARTGILHAGRSLLRAYRDGSDLLARTDMSLAGLMGGLALANARLGAVHGFAGPLGGMVDAPHGAICAALLVPVWRANIARAVDRRARFDDIAHWLTGDPAATAEDGSRWLERLVAQLDVPPLSYYGCSDAMTDEVVAKAARASSMRGNPVQFSDAELASIYRAALESSRAKG